MTRQYVHLSEDVETAIKVGGRHGKPVVINIDAKRMASENINFYLSDNNVWMTDYVSPEYILSSNYFD